MKTARATTTSEAVARDERETHMRGEALILAAVCALALPVCGIAATQPIDHFHNVFADSTNVCGIDVAETETISGSLKTTGSGVEINAYTVQNTWTNLATGKAVEFHASALNKDTFGMPVDNGDGTFSVYTKDAGMIQVKVPNGPPLLTAAGQLTGILTYDASGFVSFRVLSAGGQTPLVDDCSVIIPALT
jgi:hypothetical protein